MSVVNYVTGNVIPKNTRRNRVASMLKEQKPFVSKPFVSKVEPTLTNRFFNLFSNKTPLPKGTLKITKAVGGRMREYNKRALSFLSNRSRNVATMNLKKLSSKRNRNTLSKSYRKTKRNR